VFIRSVSFAVYFTAHTYFTRLLWDLRVSDVKFRFPLIYFQYFWYFFIYLCVRQKHHLLLLSFFMIGLIRLFSCLFFYSPFTSNNSFLSSFALIRIADILPCSFHVSIYCKNIVFLVSQIFLFLTHSVFTVYVIPPKEPALQSAFSNMFSYDLCI
jgi:hypothetical protein